MYKKVYVEITNICNMNCSFCHGHKRPPRQMSMAEFSLILDKLTGQTSYLYYHLMGEPLTHPLLCEFVKLAGTRGYKSIITTNGTLLDRWGDELLEAGLHKVNLSVHSFENGSKEDHRRYLRKLANFAQKAAALGTIVVFRLWNRDCDDGKNEITLQYLKEYLPQTWETHARGVKLQDRVFLEWGERFAWPDCEAPIQGTAFSCYGLKDQFGILSDGTVVPCCLDSDAGIRLGNIFTQNLTDILQSKRATAMVEGFRCKKATEELCKRCGYAQQFIKGKET